MNSIKIIDPHVHLFNLAQGDYNWLEPENPPYWPNKAKLKRNFTETDLQLTLPFSLQGFVHIEAGFDNNQPWREIEYLEQSCNLPFRSIAFIDLLLPKVTFQQMLDKLLCFNSVIGCRYILDQQAEAILKQKGVRENLALLAKHNLLFELQMPLGNINAVNTLITLLNALPQLKWVINHAGSCDFHKNKQTTWLSAIQKLSQFNQCAIKCSGWEMIESDHPITVQNCTEVPKIISVIINHFKPQNVMFASNFPVSNLSQNYQQLWQGYHLFAKSLHLTTAQTNAFFYENALHWYGFTNTKNQINKTGKN